MWAVAWNELWQRRWSLLWWSVGVGFFVGLDVLLYATLKDDAAQLNAAVAHLPQAVKALFSDGADLLSPAGFLSGRIYYLLLPLLLTIMAIGIGTNLIGKEEKQGTLELLLARPISRTRLLLGKVIAGLAMLWCVGGIALVTAVLTVHPAGLDVSRRDVALATLASILLSILFGSVAFVLSTLGRPLRSLATGVAALIAFGSYLLASLETIISELELPAKLSPYHYYHPSDLLVGHGSTMPMLGFALGIILLGLAAWFGFRRRDIDPN